MLCDECAICVWLCTIVHGCVWFCIVLYVCCAYCVRDLCIIVYVCVWFCRVCECVLYDCCMMLYDLFMYVVCISVVPILCDVCAMCV